MPDGMEVDKHQTDGDQNDEDQTEVEAHQFHNHPLLCSD